MKGLIYCIVKFVQHTKLKATLTSKTTLTPSTNSASNTKETKVHEQTEDMKTQPQ